MLGGREGLLTLCLEMTQGGKQTYCNSMNTPQKVFVDFKKKPSKKIKIAFSIQFLLTRRSEIILDKWDSDCYPSRCGNVSHLYVCECVCVHGHDFSSLQSFALKSAIWRA